MTGVYAPEPLTPFEKQLQEEERALVEENKRLREALEKLLPNYEAYFGTANPEAKRARAALGDPE